MKSFLKQLGLVLGLWTIAGLTLGLSNYWLGTLAGRSPQLWPSLKRPLMEQWVWAALTPLVFLLARRFPLERAHLGRNLGIHAVFFVLLSLLHCAVAQAIGTPLAFVPAHFGGSPLLLRFFQEVYSDIWMYWPLVCIQSLMTASAQARERERQASQLRATLAQAHMDLLRAQIQPHFLFNTLHAVSALMHEDVAAAEDLLADLAEILRSSFDQATAQESSLGSELNLVRCYLAIQERRFPERLKVRYHLAPETLDATVPSLVLQSLVENAVVHGIIPAGRPGLVVIRAERRADLLILEVRDDGVGLAETGSPGIGLANARRRLAYLYGTAHSLALADASGRGTTVTLSIPFRPFVEPAGDLIHDEDSHTDHRRRAAGAPQTIETAELRA
jgi:signal transduction histidine kinase